MGATRFEYRFRYALHALVFLLGFSFYLLPSARQSTWLVLTPFLERTGWFSFSTATVSLLVLAIVFASTGAFLRTWGTAFLGAGVVQSGSMHGDAIHADGPFRHSRNPLYLGTLLHALALALLMSPYGALFTIVVISIFQLRLILAEEPFLAARFGQPYLDYCKRVPRLLPSLSPRIAASGAHPRWLQAVLGEIYMIGVALSFAIFGWRYNANLLIQCVLVSLGVSFLVRAILPRKQQD